MAALQDHCWRQQHVGTQCQLPRSVLLLSYRPEADCPLYAACHQQQLLGALVKVTAYQVVNLWSCTDRQQQQQSVSQSAAVIPIQGFGERTAHEVVCEHEQTAVAAQQSVSQAAVSHSKVWQNDSP